MPANCFFHLALVLRYRDFGIRKGEYWIRLRGLLSLRARESDSRNFFVRFSFFFPLLFWEGPQGHERSMSLFLNFAVRSPSFFLGNFLASYPYLFIFFGDMTLVTYDI